MANIDKDEKEGLFRRVRTLLGSPYRKVPINDESLDDLLEVVVENYAEAIQNWLTENQWNSVFGKDIDNIDLTFALSVRPNDYEKAFTYAYSKQCGLQTDGPWELKKDYIQIVSGQQSYVIPANRELCEIMYETPSSIDAALFSSMGNGGFMGFGFGGFGIGEQLGVGAGGGMGAGGFGGYMSNTYDILLTGQNIATRRKLIMSDLTYKVTALADGRKVIHLLSVPDSRFSFGGLGNQTGAYGLGNYVGRYVWYTYYSTKVDDVTQCRKVNKNIILTPNELPLWKMNYDEFNDPTKILIRRFLTAEAELLLAKILGRFSGAVGVPDSQQKMDYEMLIVEGNELKSQANKELSERLTRLTNTSMLERRAKEAQFLNDALKFQPFPVPFKPI